jgi:hypothetical protein
MVRTSVPSFRPCVEALEDRSLLSGGLTAPLHASMLAGAGRGMGHHGHHGHTAARPHHAQHIVMVGTTGTPAMGGSSTTPGMGMTGMTPMTSGTGMTWMMPMY